MTQIVQLADFKKDRVEKSREERVKDNPSLHLEYSFKSEIFFTDRSEECIVRTELAKNTADYPTIQGWSNLYWNLQYTIYQLLDIIRDDPEFATRKDLHDVPSVVIHLSFGEQPKIHMKLFGTTNRENPATAESTSNLVRAAIVDIYRFLEADPLFFHKGDS